MSEERELYRYKKRGAIYHKLRSGTNSTATTVCGWKVHFTRHKSGQEHIFIVQANYMDYSEGDYQPCKRCYAHSSGAIA